MEQAFASGPCALVLDRAGLLFSCAPPAGTVSTHSADPTESQRSITLVRITWIDGLIGRFDGAILAQTWEPRSATAP